MMAEIIPTPLENFPDACVVRVFGCDINCSTRKEADDLVKGYNKQAVRFHGDERRLEDAE